MKNVSVIILVCCYSFISKAQTVDPDFFNQTWYLYEVFDSDFNETFTVQNYQPYAGNPPIAQINPSVIINDQLEFSGEGICNTFDGTLTQDTFGNFRTLTTAITTSTCGFFEDKIEPYLIGPFGDIPADPSILNILGPTITTDGDGFQTMRFSTQPFVTYTYRNTPVLSVTHFEKLLTVLYPNPIKNEFNIQIASNALELSNLRILSTAGQLVSEIQLHATQKTVDVAFLPNGLYFVQISVGNRIDTHKLIKE